MNRSPRWMTRKKAGLIAGISVATLCVIGTAAAIGNGPDATNAGGAQDEDRASQQQLTVVNSTKEGLTLMSASHDGPGVHWHQQATSLAAGATGVVTDYGAGDNTINLSYKGDQTGATYTIKSYVDFGNPLGGDACTATTVPADAGTAAPFTVAKTSCSGGDNLHSTFTVKPTTGFVGFTGTAQTYTVPAGYSTLQVELVGGSGFSAADAGEVRNGAQVSGVLDVTGGETFTLGVGDRAHGGLGGWGLSYGDSSFSGGNGLNSDTLSGGGGGASVLLGSGNQVIAVAGGAGGQGNDTSNGEGGSYGMGGAGGAGPKDNGAGFDGSPVGLGGKAAGNNATQGQSIDSGGQPVPGGGGGGMAGGSTGLSGTGGGGGAGSSTTNGMSSVSITTTGNYPGWGEQPHAGYVILTLLS